MIRKFSKICLLIIMSASLAGVIFFTCGFCASVPQNVTVNGIRVGGMPYAEAARTVRKTAEDYLKTKTLKITGGNSEYEFTYPEINFKDDVYRVLKSAKKGDTLTAEFSYFLCGLDEIARGICLSESVSPVEPSAKFNLTGAPFTYDEGSDGKKVDGAALKEDIRSSLCGSFDAVSLKYESVKRQKSIDDVKNGTRRIAAFTTYYDGDNLSRASNIRLAAAKLNGKILEGGKILSFNDTVGARVTSRGFLPAKIIENGEFTEGVGGGVCQVSTTLYNAALLSGLEIAEYHPHSLAVGYVPPSRDAMVSGTACDLKIRNSSDSPVYIRGLTGKNYVTFEIYGSESGAYYSLSSEVTGAIEADEELCDDPTKAREGRDGLTSQSYLTVTRGVYKKKVLLRKDKYLPVKRIKYEPPEEQPEEEKTGEEQSAG